MRRLAQFVGKHLFSDRSLAGYNKTKFTPLFLYEKLCRKAKVCGKFQQEVFRILFEEFKFNSQTMANFDVNSEESLLVAMQQVARIGIFFGLFNIRTVINKFR